MNGGYDIYIYNYVYIYNYIFNYIYIYIYIIIYLYIYIIIYLYIHICIHIYIYGSAIVRSPSPLWCGGGVVLYNVDSLVITKLCYL